MLCNLVGVSQRFSWQFILNDLNLVKAKWVKVENVKVDLINTRYKEWKYTMTMAKSMNDEVKSVQTNVLNLKSTLLLIIIQMRWSLGKHNLSLLKQFWVKMTLKRDKTRWVGFSKGSPFLSPVDHETTYVKVQIVSHRLTPPLANERPHTLATDQSEASKVSQTPVSHDWPHNTRKYTPETPEVSSKFSGSDFSILLASHAAGHWMLPNRK